MPEQEARIEAEPVWAPEDEIIIPLERVPQKPLVPPTIIPEVEPKKTLLVNIETLGTNPFKDRIIAIGVADPAFPDEPPTVLMTEDERDLINIFFNVVRDGGYELLVGYGFTFDFRFLLVRGMYYNLACKEFYDCDILDLMQIMAQGKPQFMYYPPKPPKLSDVAEFFWDFPKQITDLEMMQAYVAGDTETVRKFCRNQMYRIMALYVTWKSLTLTPAHPQPLAVSPIPATSSKPPTSGSPFLTQPGGTMPEGTALWRCPICLSEQQTSDKAERPECLICHKPMERVA